jgi:hypothetical protein
VQIGKQTQRAGPEPLQLAAQLVAQRGAHPDQVFAPADQRPQRLGLIRIGLKHPEAVMVSTREFASHERVKPIRLAAQDANPIARGRDLIGVQGQHPSRRPSSSRSSLKRSTYLSASARMAPAIIRRAPSRASSSSATVILAAFPGRERANIRHRGAFLPAIRRSVLINREGTRPSSSAPSTTFGYSPLASGSLRSAAAGTTARHLQNPGVSPFWPSGVVDSSMVSVSPDVEERGLHLRSCLESQQFPTVACTGRESQQSRRSRASPACPARQNNASRWMALCCGAGDLGRTTTQVRKIAAAAAAILTASASVTRG